MDEKKQIEEMALAICKSRGVAYVDDCEKCRMHEDCLYQEIACGLYRADYRKQIESHILEKYKQKMTDALDDHDEECGHRSCDYVLCELLRELGYDEIVSIYEKQHKWYS